MNSEKGRFEGETKIRGGRLLIQGGDFIYIYIYIHIYIYIQLIILGVLGSHPNRSGAPNFEFEVGLRQP